MLQADNAQTGALTTREASDPNDESTQDTTGAVLDLGDGDDTITLVQNDWEVDETLVVDRGAELIGGAGIDSLTISSTDNVEVVESKAYTATNPDNDLDTGLDIVMGGVDSADYMDGQGGYVRGIENITLIAENSVSEEEDEDGIDGDDDAGTIEAATDDGDAIPATFDLDVEQVDEDLETIELVSLEQRLELDDESDTDGTETSTTTPGSGAVGETGPTTEETGSLTYTWDNGFIAGDASTEFSIDNLRGDIAVSLSAYEATGVSEDHTETEVTRLDTGTQLTYSDTIVGEGFDLEDDCETDVTVNINMDAQAPGLEAVGAYLGVDVNRAFTLDLEANADLASQTGEHNYDVDLNSENQFKQDSSDSIVDDGDNSDLDARYARDITINVNTGASHHIDVTDTFGNVGDSEYAVYDTDDDLDGYGAEDYIGTVDAASAADAVASFADGVFAVQGDATETSLTVNADADGEIIELVGVHADTVTATGMSDFIIEVDESNDYSITTDSGDDVFLMGMDALDDDDVVDGGAGHDMMVIGYLGSVLVDVDSVTNVEELVIGMPEGGLQDVQVQNLNTAEWDQVTIINFPADGLGDEDGIDDNDVTPVGVQGVWVQYDNDGEEGTSLRIEADTSGPDRVALCDDPAIDFHSDELVLLIENTGAGAPVDLTVSVNASEGTQIVLDTEDDDDVTIEFTVSGIVDNVVLGDVTTGDSGSNDNNTPADEGELGLSVLGGDIDRIIIDGDANGGYVDVIVNDDWSSDSLLIDASQVIDADDDSWLGAIPDNIHGDEGLETDATLTIFATQSSDWIWGGRLNDNLYGLSGDDEIYGGLGSDTIEGGFGDDLIQGGMAGDVLTGGGSTAGIAGGADSTLDTGNDIFMVGYGTDAQTAIDHSNAGLNGQNADVITDFETGSDILAINLGTLLDADADNQVDLSSFAVVSNTASGDDSLVGSVITPVALDMFYSEDIGAFVMDVDGNGDITTNQDIVVFSENAINASDMWVSLDAGAGDDIIRMGQGIEIVDGGAGDDTFVIVGSITQADQTTYSADFAGDDGDAGMNSISDYGLDSVVDENLLMTQRAETEAQDGDAISGGVGNDVLHVYGTTDLTDVDIDVENMILHSSVTIFESQYAAFSVVVLDDSTTHNLTIIDQGDVGLALNNILIGSGTLVLNGEEYDLSDAGDVGDLEAATGVEHFATLEEFYAAYPTEITSISDAGDDAGNDDDVTNIVESGNGGIVVSGTSFPGANITVTATQDDGSESFDLIAVADSNGDWSVEFNDELLDYEGEMSFSISVIGILGNTVDNYTIDEAEDTETIDTIAPVALNWELDVDSGDSDSDEITNNGEIVTDEEMGATVEYYDGGIWSTDPVVPMDSSEYGDTISYQIRQVDAAGNIGPATSVEFTFDDNAPSITISTVAGDDYINSDEKAAGVTITGTAEGANGSVITVDLNGVAKTATVAGNAWSVSYASGELPADGLYTVVATVTDVAGNQIVETRGPVTVDTTADVIPLTTVTFNDGDGYINAAESGAAEYEIAGVDADAVNVTVSISDGTNTVVNVYGSAAAANGTHTADLSGLDDGSLSISIVVEDIAGNTGVGTGDSSTLDTTADSDPGVAVAFSDSLINAAESTATEVSVSGVDPDAQATVTITSSGGGSVSEIFLGNGARNIDVSALGDGELLATVEVVDTAGNMAEGTPASSELDTTAPTVLTASISSDNANDAIYAMNSDTITIEFTVDEPLASVAVTIEGEVATVVDGGSGSYTATLQLSGDESEGPASFEIDLVDVAGNPSVTQTTTTDASSVLIDFTNPEQSNTQDQTVDENIAGGTAIVTGTAVETGSGVSHWEIVAGDDGALFDIDSMTGEITIVDSPDYEALFGDNNDASGVLEYSVRVYDNAGNYDQDAYTLTVNNLDEESPVLPDDATIAVDENISAGGSGTVIYTAVADDSQDISAGVSYSLAEVDDWEAFTIDPVTGEIRFVTSPDREAQESYNITIVADDGVNATDSQNLTIDINDLNDVDLEITSIYVRESGGTYRITIEGADDATENVSLIDGLPFEGIEYTEFDNNGDGTFSQTFYVDALAVPENVWLQATNDGTVFQEETGIFANVAIGTNINAGWPIFGDELSNTDYIDIILGFDGEDTVFATADTDFFTSGGLGEDNFSGDIIFGGGEDDTIYFAQQGEDYDPVGEDISGVGAWVDGGGGEDYIYPGFVWQYADDTLIGGNGDDTIYGGAGDDFIHGAYAYDYGGEVAIEDLDMTDNDTDYLYGEDGDDTFFAEDRDRVYGGAGNDTVYYDDDVYSGQLLDDELVSVENIILAGEDTFNFAAQTEALNISVYEPDYWLEEQQIYGGSAGDTINAGLGDDTIYGGSGADYIYGGDGDDDIYGNTRSAYVDSQSDYLYGGSGDDYFYASDIDAIYGGDGDEDTVKFDDDVSATNLLDDDLQGVERVSIGDVDADQLDFSAQTEDLYISTAYGATITGGAGQDTIVGTGANDQVVEDATENEVFTLGAGTGDTVNFTGDVTAAELVDDDLTGVESVTGDGDLDFSAQSEGLEITGGIADQTIVGGGGADTINGGPGSDTLTGGDGADDFVLNTADFGETDVITDFESAVDDIDLGGSPTASYGNFEVLNGTDAGSDYTIDNDVTDGDGSGVITVAADLQLGEAADVLGDVDPVSMILERLEEALTGEIGADGEFGLSDASGNFTLAITDTDTGNTYLVYADDGANGRLELADEVVLVGIIEDATITAGDVI